MAMDGDGICFFILWLLIAFMIGVTVGVCKTQKDEKGEKMKIIKITDEKILFDNGKIITFRHDQDCCEDNYADFGALTKDTINIDYDFDEKNMKFEFKNNEGFVFGNDGHMVFVPCYSEQNGYYTTNLEILYGDVVCSGAAKEKIL